jgi:hypothetical protein
LAASSCHQRALKSRPAPDIPQDFDSFKKVIYNIDRLLNCHVVGCGLTKTYQIFTGGHTYEEYE